MSKSQLTDNKLHFDPVTQDDPNNDGKNPGSMAPIIFNSGGSKVLGTLFLASGDGFHPTALLLGGFPGNEVNFDIAHMIRRQGYNVFTFYPRGCWGSEGYYSWINLIEDGANAFRFLQSSFVKNRFRVDPAKIILVGHSMGGFSALFNSILLGEVKNVCAIAPLNAGYFGEFLDSNLPMKSYSAEQMHPAMDFVNCNSAEELLEEFVNNRDEWNLLNHLEKLSQKNILLIGARYDSLVPLSMHHQPLQQKLHEVGSNFESHVLETGHSFSDKRIQLMRIISEWINKIEF